MPATFVPGNHPILPLLLPKDFALWRRRKRRRRGEEEEEVTANDSDETQEPNEQQLVCLLPIFLQKSPES